MLQAWKKFSKGKRSHEDVATFELHLEEHLFHLRERLARGTWRNDPYMCRRIADPKPRIIHIASVRDRVLFQAVYQQLYPIFEKTFIHDSYASREGKGTHAGVKRFEVFARKVSANHTCSAFVLKCDVRKFFDRIDHQTLYTLLAKKVSDMQLFSLLRTIIGSFETSTGKGLPLGNVTSQLFSNIYLNELDQFIKHGLHARYFIRYCDDFVMLSDNLGVLQGYLRAISDFLSQRLFLELHPHKVTIHKLRQGTDFLGYVSLPHYSVLRTKTKQRMVKRLSALAKSIATQEDFEQALPIINSYLGVLSHCKGTRLRAQAMGLFEKWR